MTDPQSDPTAIALAHNEVLAVVAPDGVDAAIARVMARHRDELDVALRPYGVELRDLLQPAWMRVVRFEDVQGLAPGPSGIVSSVGDPVDLGAPYPASEAPAGAPLFVEEEPSA